MWAIIISIIIGLGLMIAPEYFNFYNDIEADNLYIVGPLVVTFSILALWEFNRSLRFFNTIAGAWLIVSPFLLPYESQEGMWCSIAPGALLFILSFVKGSIRHQY